MRKKKKTTTHQAINLLTPAPPPFCSHAQCLNGSRATVVGDEFHQRAKRVRAQYLAAIHRRFFKRMVAVHDVKLRLEPIAMVEQYQRVTQVCGKKSGRGGGRGG